MCKKSDIESSIYSSPDYPKYELFFKKYPEYSNHFKDIFYLPEYDRTKIEAYYEKKKDDKLLKLIKDGPDKLTKGAYGLSLIEAIKRGLKFEIEKKDEKLDSAKRPIFVWISGIGLMLFSTIIIINYFLGIPFGKNNGLLHPSFSIMPLFLFLVGIGLFTGRFISLVFAKLLWVLWLILVVLSFFAAGITSQYGGGGPDWSHGLGILVIIVTAQIWSSSVKSYCNKSILGKKENIEKEG